MKLYRKKTFFANLLFSADFTISRDYVTPCISHSCDEYDTAKSSYKPKIVQSVESTIFCVREIQFLLDPLAEDSDRDGTLCSGQPVGGHDYDSSATRHHNNPASGALTMTAGGDPDSDSGNLNLNSQPTSEPTVSTGRGR